MTASGRATVGIGVVLVVLGFVLGYPGLVLLGSGLSVLVLLAGLMVLGRPAFEVRRIVTPDRIARGDQAEAELTITTSGRMPARLSSAIELFDGHRVEVVLPVLAAGAARTIRYPLPPSPRGVHQVGPMRLQRSDPFGLIRRFITDSSQVMLYVRPRTYPLRLTSGGRWRRSDAMDSGSGSSGSVEFASIREYVFGDDMRHVHWPLSAHHGELLVRQYVDPDVPRGIVALDAGRQRLTADQFEEAVEVAASIMVALADDGAHGELFAGDGSHIVVGPNGVDRSEVLDALTHTQLVEGASLPDLLGEVAALAGSLFVITGAKVDDQAILAEVAGRPSGACVVIRVGAARRGVTELAGVQAIDLTLAGELPELWSGTG